MKRAGNALFAALAASTLLIGSTLLGACNNPFGGDDTVTAERPAKQWLSCTSLPVDVSGIPRVLPDSMISPVAVDTIQARNMHADGVHDEVWVIAETDSLWYRQMYESGDTRWTIVTNTIDLLCINDTEQMRSLVANAVSARGDVIYRQKSYTTEAGGVTYNWSMTSVRVNCADSYPFSSSEPVLDALDYYSDIHADVSVSFDVLPSF